MKILIDTARFYYSPRNTDWRMKQCLVAALSDFGAFVPKGILWNFIYNFIPLMVRFVPSFLRDRWWILGQKARALIAKFYAPDWIVSQGENPPLIPRVKTVWETYFLKDRAIIRDLSEFKRGGKDLWIRQMEKYGGRVDIIGVRGEASVRLLKEMYPEYAHKVRDLGFVRPEYAIADPEWVMKKQNADGLVSLLFVGRQALVKGLDGLLEACERLYASGVKKFHLTVVSTLANAPAFAVPNVEWLTYYRELPHKNVMQMMHDAQIFIMPSRSDSYGLVYHEAMANGCVTFVRDAEPQREFVDYEKAGFCVSCDDIEGMVEKLKTAICDKSLRTEIALRGLQRYKERYSQTVIRQSWRGVFA